MKERVKQLWVDALRSGEYKQATGALRKNTAQGTSFCCLGVLCNLHALEHPRSAAKEDNPNMYGGEGAVPPAKVLKWAGISINNTEVQVTYKGKKTDLICLNDSEKLSFKQIANVIERCL